METSRVRTSRKALERFFCRDRMRVALEAGGSSQWVSRLLGSIGHEVVVCSPRRVRRIAESSLKNDKVDAELLARLVRLDPEFLKPIQHRSEQAQLLRGNLKVRSAMVEARTKWINTIRGLLRSFGYNVSGKVAHTFVERVDLMKLPDDLRAVIAAPLLEQLDLLTGEIERRNEQLEEMVKELPEVEHLREIPGVGPVVATYFVLTIDDPGRFKNSRDVASFFVLRPSMRESASVSQFGRITKEGDPEMRGKEYPSNEITIRNTPPVIRRAMLLPPKPVASSVLKIELASDDADNDAVSYVYKWHVNGKLVSDRTYLEHEFKRGNKVEIEIIPSDGESTGNSVILKETIVNFLPNCGSAEL